MDEPDKDSPRHRDGFVEQVRLKLVVAVREVLRLMQRELLLQGFARLPRIVRVLTPDFQHKILGRGVVKKWGEMHHHAFERVRLLQVKPQRQLPPNAIQGPGLFCAAIVVGVVILERLDMHNAVVVGHSILVRFVGRANFRFPEAHVERGEATDGRIEQGHGVRFSHVIRREEARNRVVGHVARRRGPLVHGTELIHALGLHADVLLTVRSLTEASVNRHSFVGGVRILVQHEMGPRHGGPRLHQERRRLCDKGNFFKFWRGDHAVFAHRDVIQQPDIHVALRRSVGPEPKLERVVEVASRVRDVDDVRVKLEVVVDALDFCHVHPFHGRVLEVDVQAIGAAFVRTIAQSTALVPKRQRHAVQGRIRFEQQST